MRFQTVSGIDVLRMIRTFERINNVPPCFLMCTDGARSILMGHVSSQLVMDCGVDFIVPWYRAADPLYDALAAMRERSSWRDRPIVLTGVLMPGTITNSELA